MRDKENEAYFSNKHFFKLGNTIAQFICLVLGSKKKDNWKSKRTEFFSGNLLGEKW
jgi:hypothetical protein